MASNCDVAAVVNQAPIPHMTRRERDGDAVANVPSAATDASDNEISGNPIQNIKPCAGSYRLARVIKTAVMVVSDSNSKIANCRYPATTGVSVRDIARGENVQWGTRNRRNKIVCVKP